MTYITRVLNSHITPCQGPYFPESRSGGRKNQETTKKACVELVTNAYISVIITLSRVFMILAVPYTGEEPLEATARETTTSLSRYFHWQLLNDLRRKLPDQALHTSY